MKNLFQSKNIIYPVLTIGIFNNLITLIISIIISIIYMLNTLSYYPESDNIGMLVVPMFLLALFPFTLSFLLLVEFFVIKYVYRVNPKNIFGIISLSLIINLFNLIAIPLIFLIITFVMSMIIY